MFTVSAGFDLNIIVTDSVGITAGKPSYVTYCKTLDMSTPLAATDAANEEAKFEKLNDRLQRLESQI